ncbi:LysR substrate-binding domain-containing protein [Nocardioides speluncae]|uniref:LysR substrate-binding domain-containing protein n=1 Tax=Nocardioides speluncae TaxID=2670337 RepID=UPI000D68C40C|nr:LysR substrate-binding domain-containing protein [Nocardioides speluncae]
MTLTIAYVAGAAPDKWARRWRQREAEPLELVAVSDDEQLAVLGDGRAEMSVARLPVDRERHHVIQLYVEVPVVVVPKEHPVAAYDEVRLADLAGEQLIQDPETVPGWADLDTPKRLNWPAMSAKEAIEVVASGTGIVIVPMSVARLHHRKDVVHRPVIDGPESQVALVWLRENDDPRLQTFVGIVRGRSARSSRDAEPAPKKAKPTAKKAAPKTPRPTQSKRVPARGRRRAR